MIIDESKASRKVRFRRIHVVVFLSLWACLITSGMLVLTAYSNTPGQAPQDSLSSWPKDSDLAFHQDTKNLLIFIHPKCPCSRATLSELARLQAECVDCLDTRFVFFVPRGESKDWAQSDLWRTARTLSQHECYYDVEGVESRRFGATTSGHVALFGRDGSLLFSGGITAARGHEGDNLGRTTIVNLAHDKLTRAHSVPVFGCEIQQVDRTPCCNPTDVGK